VALDRRGHQDIGVDEDEVSGHRRRKGFRDAGRRRSDRLYFRTPMNPYTKRSVEQHCV
jgi:hypothetical protein